MESSQKAFFDGLLTVYPTFKSLSLASGWTASSDLTTQNTGMNLLNQYPQDWALEQNKPNFEAKAAVYYQSSKQVA